MDIITAKASDLKIVKSISHSTINAVYPHYYPAGAVDFSSPITAVKISSAISKQDLFT